MNRLKRNEGDTKISREKWLKSGSQDPKWELWTRVFNLQEWAFINAKSFLTPPHTNSNFCLKHIKIKLTELKWLNSFHNSNFCNLSSLYYIVYLLSLKLLWKWLGFGGGAEEWEQGLLMPKRLLEILRWNIQVWIVLVCTAISSQIY